MASVVLGGPELSDFSLSEPAASVRVLLPSTPGADLVVPVWTGNEFLLPNGERPVIRTLTPRRFDAIAAELEVQIVVHDGGAASGWVSAAAPGDAVAMSGPGRGYRIDAGRGWLPARRGRDGDPRHRPAPGVDAARGRRRGAHRGRPARGGASAPGAGATASHGITASRARALPATRSSRQSNRRRSRMAGGSGPPERPPRCTASGITSSTSSACHAPANRPRVLEARPSGRRRLTFAQSGRRESNPRSQLGKLMFCR